MSDKFRTFAMSYFCSFPPKFTFPRCSEEFLIPVAKIQNIYHIDNQFVINFKPISRLSLVNSTLYALIWYCWLIGLFIFCHFVPERN